MVMCFSRVAGVARGMVGRCMHFPHVDGRQIVPKEGFPYR